MPQLRIVRAHDLPHDDVRAEIEALAADLQRTLHARYHWEGDTLRFERSGASGTVNVLTDRVEIDLKLGIALAPMKRRIERTITDYLDEHLA